MKTLDSLKKLLRHGAALGLATIMIGCVGRRESRTYTFDQTPNPGRPIDVANTVGQGYRVETPEPAPATVQGTPNTLDMRTELVRVQKRAPATATLGETIENAITLTPLTHVGNVVLTHYLSTGSTFVKAEPPAMVTGNKLVWTFDQLKSGDVQNLKVWVKPTAEGAMTSCTTVTAQPFGCVTTQVGKPALSIEKTGPEMAQVGERVTYNIVVRNSGTSTAEKVEVTDMIPAGLSHESGRNQLVFEAGTLRPGEAKQATVTLTAQQRGVFTNNAIAKSENAGSVSDDAVTRVVQPGLKVTKTGPPQQFLGKSAQYRITVSNVGDTALNNVTVTDTAPGNATISDATGAQLAGNQATWTIATLAAGQSASFDVGLRASAAGTTVNTVTARSADGLSDSAQAQTVWLGFAAVLVEMVDDPDPLLVGETTTYTLKVINQGTAADHNVEAVIIFPPQMQPVSAAGVTPGKVEGQKVTLSPLAVIGPKESAVWTVKAKAVTVGDARIRAEIKTELLKSQPVLEVEATQVY